MNKRFIGIICGALLGAAGTVYGQSGSGVQVRGTITAIDGNMLAVKTREGRDIKIELDKSTTVAYMKGLKLADIKAGTGLGTTAVEGADGKLVAREIHVFPPERGVANPTHFAMAEPKTTMTNGTVTATVQANNGREIVINYKDGTKVVQVPDNTPVVMAMPGDRSYLVPGEYVYLTAAMNNDGKLTASRVQVSKDGVRPPQ